MLALMNAGKKAMTHEKNLKHPQAATEMSSCPPFSSKAKSAVSSE